jgi:RHS repeat-associated protein
MLASKYRPQSCTCYIGREHDNESDLGFYGMRLYEPEYGRFLAVDKLWEKYRSLQPYQYAANSPVMAVDRNGKEIQVVDPETGTAYVFDGSQLVSKDDGAVLQDAQGFVKVVQDGLLRLMQMKDNAQDIGTLIRSDLVTTISMNSVDGSEVLSNHPNGPTEGAALATYDGVGSDALMRLSPAVMTKTFQESTVELAHEARHAYHIVTGTRADDAEAQGLMAENAARYELGLPLRLSYGSRSYSNDTVVPWWIPRSR